MMKTENCVQKLGDVVQGTFIEYPANSGTLCVVVSHSKMFGDKLIRLYDGQQMSADYTEEVTALDFSDILKVEPVRQ